MKNHYIMPEIGRVYTLRDGGEYRCLWVSNTAGLEQGECSAVMIRDKDGWKLTVHGLQQSENDKVEWDYSTGGHWSKNSFEVWKDSELGPTYMVKKFSTKDEAEAWISSNEKSYPGWHLRVEATWQKSIETKVQKQPQNILEEDGKTFILKNIEFPGHNISNLETEIKKGAIDIPCRIYLEKSPCQDYEAVAKEADKENYNPSCFFIEALVGRDSLEEPWQTSNWFAFYVDNTGNSHLLDDTIELPNAWDYVKKEYETIKTNVSLDTKIAAASERAGKVELGDLSSQHKQNSEATRKVMDFIME